MRVDAPANDMQLQATQSSKSKERNLQAQIDNAVAEQAPLKGTQVNQSSNEAIRETLQGEMDEG